MGKLMKGLKEARTEDQQWTVLMKHIHPSKTKHLTEAGMKKFRRSAAIGTGWTVPQLDAWLEECIDMGWINTPMTLHRELAIAARMTEDEPEKEHMIMKTRVKYYLAEKGWKHLKAAQLATLKDNLRGG